MAKKVVITGSSRGIGAACAREFSHMEYDVTVNYNNSRDKAEALAKELSCRAVKADISDAYQADELIRQVGDTDILICNAGIALQKMLCDTNPEEWRHVFAVNTDGVYNVCRAAIPHMVHEKWGRIIIISSMWGIRGASCETAYSASKAALLGFTKALAKELGPSGITVNCIAPGVIDTEMNGNLSADVLDELRDQTPLCRLGTPEDIAYLAAFLASERASFITGQIIAVDGGFSV